MSERGEAHGTMVDTGKKSRKDRGRQTRDKTGDAVSGKMLMEEGQH